MYRTRFIVAALPLFLLVTTPMLVSHDGQAQGQGKGGGPATFQLAFLELDGVITGLLPSAEGGNAFADVIVEPIGPDHIQRKHIGGVKYEDIAVTSDLPMASGFGAWVAASLGLDFQIKSGAVVIADRNFNESSRVNFSNALITEVGFPALDAGSKDAAKMTIKFQPETTRFVGGSGGRLPGATVPKTHHFLSSNFRLAIDGLDCRKVTKIEPITATLVFALVTGGDSGRQQLQPVTWNYTNLRLTLPEFAAKSFIDYYQDFVIQGNNGDDQEKSGSLSYLSPDLKTELGRINFGHIGIYKLTRPKVVSGTTSGIRMITVDLYFETLQFVTPK
jgi:hypothetical protein